MDARSFEYALRSLNLNEVERRESSLVQGRLHFESEREPWLEIPFGTLIKRPKDDGMVCHNDEPLGYEAAYGFSRDNFFFALKNPVVSEWSTCCPGFSKQTIKSEWAICADKPVYVNPQVNAMTVKLDGLREWVGVSAGITIHRFSEENGVVKSATGVSFEYSANDAKDICLFKRNDICLTIRHIGVQQSAPASPFDFRFSEDCELLINFRDGRPALDVAIRDVLFPVWNFLNYCMGWRSEIHSIAFKSDDISASLYLPLVSGRVASRELTVHMPLSLSFLGERRCQECLGKRLSFQGYEKEAAKACAAFPGSWEAPLPLLFLFAANAFEAASRVGAEETELDEGEFQRRLSAVLDALPGAKTKRWAERKLKYCNYKEAGELADGLFARLGSFSAYVAPNRGTFLTELRIARNRHTHLRDLDDPEVPRDDDLYALLCAVQTMTYGAVMMQLGFGAEEVLSRFRETHFMEAAISVSRRRYSCEPAIK